MNNADKFLAQQIHRLSTQVDRVFAFVIAVQSIAAVAIALVVSPRTWSGSTDSIHPHVIAACAIAMLTGPSVGLLAWRRPGETRTRHFVAATQMVFSILFIHLTAGRIETHFHIFVSLGFLALYRDWKVIITATLVVAIDHVLRSILWPESLFGTSLGGWWPDFLRALEHAGWVIFADVILIWGCVRARRDSKSLAEVQAIEVERQQQLVAAILHEARNLADATRYIGRLADGLDENARSTATAAKATEGTIREMAIGIKRVSDHTAQLNDAIDEIARASTEAASTSNQARERSTDAAKSMRTHLTASTNIVDVASTIRSIADKTRLLALNATIEAASAGEAGRGFTVVANEVKALAQQTEVATTRVTSDINILQESTVVAVKEMEDVAGIIARIDHASKSIATAVNEQSLTTREIGLQALSAAEAGRSIAQSATSVVTMSTLAADGVGELRRTIADLQRMAGNLESLSVSKG